MRERLQFVDGLRGLAVLLTVLCHSWLYGGLYRTSLTLDGVNLSYWFATFTVGVNLFMVISGFCLTYPLVQDGGWREMNVGDFFRHRVLRIVPPYYAAIALFVLLNWLGPLLYTSVAPTHISSFYPHSFAAIAGHVLFSYNIIASFGTDMPSLNGSFWSIELEAQFYLLLPLLILVARRFGVVRMVAGVLALTFVWRLIVWYVAIPNGDTSWEYLLIRMAPARLFEFALGILAAVIYVRYRHRIRPLPTFVLALVVLGVGLDYFYVKQGQFAPLTDIVIGAGFFLLLLAASVPGLSQRIFTWRPLAWVGLISYSIYLVHEPFVKELYTWFPGKQGLDAFITYSLGFTALMVLLGYVFYRLVELPSIQWGRQLLRRPPLPAASVEAAESLAAP